MLLFGDAYAHYGTGTTAIGLMLEGIWAAVSDQSTSSDGPSTANPRPNAGSHHFRTIGSTASVSARRRAIGANQTTVGQGGAFYFAALPPANAGVGLMQFRDSANADQCTLTIKTDGALEVRTQGIGGTVIATSAAGVIAAGSYHHVEWKVTIGNSGTFEVRVNEEVVLSGTGDTQGTLNAGADHARWSIIDNSVTMSNFVVDDTDSILWNTSGSFNNDFMGDGYWDRIDPNADTATSDWTRNTGSNDFETIDDTTPDDDTTYIEATAAANVSDFDLSALDPLASEVLAVMHFGRRRKTTAGDGSVQAALVPSSSPETPDSGANNALTTSYAYYLDLSDSNPASGVVWMPADFADLRIRLTRTL